MIWEKGKKMELRIETRKSEKGDMNDKRSGD